MNSDGTRTVCSTPTTARLIEADGRGGCRVITEECQNGLVPKLAWWYLRPMLLRGHQNWVESLKRVAEGGDTS